MEDPEYIVLAALDTPSRHTGIYISGGVMAAPTVGAIMEELLPYLGVKQNFTQEDAAGRTVIVEDYSGLTAKEAEKRLKESGLGAKLLGSSDTVTAQIPAVGQSVPGGSEVILYFGQQPENELTTVPNFIGMNRQQASDAADKAGIYILVAGNSSVDRNVVVTEQSEPHNAQVPAGTTVRLTFTDTKAAD
jgi:stage V sporulation protein D (sporulation-specific penicillin-binding protein)